MLQFVLQDHNNVRRVSIAEELSTCEQKGSKYEAALLHYGERSAVALMERFNWELFDRLPYNLNLTPSYYYLFHYLKSWRCQHLAELSGGRL
jgi:hypothetical protein